MKTLLLSAALLLPGGFAMANITPDDLIAEFQAQGFTTIEIKTGLTQTKLEAVMGRRKVEIIYDTASGTVLKQESERAKRREANQGVEVQTVDRDFLSDGSGGSGPGIGDDDGAGHDAGDDHGDDGDDHDSGDDHGGGDDGGDGPDDGDDHGGDGHGGDDHGRDGPDDGDDHGGHRGHGGGHSGHGGHGSDD